MRNSFWILAFTTCLVGADHTTPLRERLALANADFMGAPARVSNDQLRRRLEDLEKLAEIDPRSVRSFILSPKELAALPPAATPFLEHYESYTGPVEVIVEDREPNSVFVYRYRQPGSNEWQSARIDGRDAKATGCADQMTLRTVHFGAQAIVADEQLISKSAFGDPACPTIGEQRTAVILVNLPGKPALPITPARVKELMFGNTGITLNRMLAANSYGKASLTGDVFGPFTLTENYPCGLYSIGTPAMLAAQKQVNLGAYRRIVVISPNNPSACGFAGIGTLGCVSYPPEVGGMRASLQYDFLDESAVTSSDLELRINKLLGTIHHELGHNLGLNHSKLLVFNNQALGLNRKDALVHEYGDPFSTMGRSFTENPYSVNQKLLLGWLTPAQVVPVNSSGVFALAPLSSPTSGLKALQIRRMVAGQEQSLYLHFERRDNLFEALPQASQLFRASTDVALVRQAEDSGETDSFLLDMTPEDASDTADPSRSFISNQGLQKGARWSDPYSPLSIQVLDVTDSALTVRVDYETACASFELARVTTVLAGGGIVSVNVSAPTGCDWELRTQPYWLTPILRKGSGPATLSIQFPPNPSPLARTASLILGRTTRQLIQDGPSSPPRIVAAAPNGGILNIGSTTQFSAVLSDENGQSDLRYIYMTLGATADPKAGCSFRIDASTGIPALANLTGTGFEIPTSVNARNNQFCSLGNFVTPRNLTFRLSEILFALDVTLKPTSTSQLYLFVEVEDKAGLRSSWKSDLLTAQSACRLEMGSSFHFFLQGGEVELPVSTGGCPLSPKSDRDWIQVTGLGPASVRLKVPAHTGTALRQGYLEVNGRKMLITQAGTEQLLRPPLQPQEWEVSDAGGKLQFQIGLPESYFEGIRVTSTAAWLSARSLDNAGGPFTFVEATAEANPDPQPREADLIVLGSVFRVRQTASLSNIRPTFLSQNVTNLNGDVGWINPGGFITIYGSNLSNTTRAWTGEDFINSNLPQALDGVSAKCDDQPLYPAFVSPGQLNLYFDFNQLSRSTSRVNEFCQLRVTRSGVTSLSTRLLYGNLYATAIGIPHANGLQAAAIFPDGTLAGIYGRRPAAGDLISLFATGLGETVPMPTPGKLLTAPLPLRTLPTVLMGGHRATVEWGGLVATGLYQLNLRIPPGAAGGRVTVWIYDQAAGDAFAPRGNPGFVWLETQ